MALPSEHPYREEQRPWSLSRASEAGGTVTKQDQNVSDGLSLLRNIQARTLELLVGDPSDLVTGIKGTRVSTRWQVVEIHQTSPTGMLPKPDPTFERHRATYAVNFYRTA